LCVLFLARSTTKSSFGMVNSYQRFWVTRQRCRQYASQKSDLPMKTNGVISKRDSNSVQCKGAIIPGARKPVRLNWVRRHLIFMGPQYSSRSWSPFWRLEIFLFGSSITVKFVDNWCSIKAKQSHYSPRQTQRVPGG